MIGDHKSIGLSQRQYRTAKQNLEKWKISTFKTTNKGTVARIINSSIYDINLESSDKLPDKRPTNKPTTNKKVYKNVKNKTYAQSFNDFWNIYPKKIGKEKAFTAWKTHNCDSIVAIIIKSVKAHISSKQWKKDEGEFIPHPTTFINQHRWDDEVEMPKIITQSTMKSGSDIVEKWKKDAEGR